MEVKRAAGRPRLPKTKKKSKVIAVRITESQRDEIIILFGSIQKFFEEAIVTSLKGKKRNEKTENS